MRGFTRDDIIAHRFTSGRRKGYDTLEVDGYLERLAEHVGWMQTELAKHQATERSALDVLLQAQRVADETVAAAQRDADTLRRNAECGLENARTGRPRHARRSTRPSRPGRCCPPGCMPTPPRAAAASQIAELEAAGRPAWTRSTGWSRICGPPQQGLRRSSAPQARISPRWPITSSSSSPPAATRSAGTPTGSLDRDEERIEVS